MRGQTPSDWISLNRAIREYRLTHHRRSVQLCRRAGIPLRRFGASLALRRVHLTILIEWNQWWRTRPKGRPEPAPPARDELLFEL